MSSETWEWHGKAPAFEPMHSTCPLFARKLAPETQDAVMAALWPERVHAERERTASVLPCMECVVQRPCACILPKHVASQCHFALHALLLVQFVSGLCSFYRDAQTLSSSLKCATLQEPLEAGVPVLCRKESHPECARPASRVVTSVDSFLLL